MGLVGPASKYTDMYSHPVSPRKLEPYRVFRVCILEVERCRWRWGAISCVEPSEINIIVTIGSGEVERIRKMNLALQLALGPDLIILQDWLKESMEQEETALKKSLPRLRGISRRSDNHKVLWQGPMRASVLGRCRACEKVCRLECYHSKVPRTEQC